MEKNAKELLRKYNAGMCTDEEKAYIESWYLQWRGSEADLEVEERVQAKNEVWNQIIKSQRKKQVFRLTYMTAAAVVVVLLTVGILFRVADEHGTLPNDQAVLLPSGDRQDVNPGGNKALLTLADGTTVALDEAADGAISEIAGMVIRKTADGQIVYEAAAKRLATAQIDDAPRFNRISTPRGGQYQIVLPDGTKVWLNSASSLRYPIQFTADERRVELTGEAYFEVTAHEDGQGEKIPFRVETATQVVEVLGTQFNINSYSDEDAVKTTLLEGSVRVFTNLPGRTDNRGVLLEPNQQSVLKYGTLDVVRVSAGESTAWKEGYFNFNEADLATVMRQLARWYDVDVVYEGTIPQGTYSGKVYRNMSLSKVLDVLTYAEVNFRIEGKTMFISP